MKTQLSSLGWLLLLALALARSAAAQTQGGDIPVPWLESIGAVPTLIQSPFTLDLLGAAGFDSNIYDNDAQRLGDSVFEPGVNAGFQQEAFTEREKTALDYQGMGLIYPSHPVLDQFNQSLAFHGDYEPGQRWVLRAADSTYYQTGLFGFNPGSQTFTAPSVLPLTSNPLVVTPVSRVLSNQSRLDVSYQLSPNASVDVFENYGLLHYSDMASAATLFNTQTLESGVSYVQRVSRTIWIGPTFSEAWMHFGTLTQSRLVSAAGSLTWVPSPNWTYTAFVGAQHVDLNQQVDQTLAGLGTLQIGIIRTNSHPEGGGSVTRSWHRVAATASGQRTVTDGGGLLTTSVNTLEQLDLRLVRNWDTWSKWDGSLELANALSSSLSPNLANAELRDLRLGLVVSYRLSDALSLRVTDQKVRQTTSNLPEFDNANRNLFLLGVDFRIAGPPGGMN